MNESLEELELDDEELGDEELDDEPRGVALMRYQRELALEQNRPGP